MKKHIFIVLILICCTVFFILYYSKEYEEPPKIEVSYNGNRIEYTVGLNTWGNAKYDRESVFTYLMKNKTKEELMYIPIGNEITITFMGRVPNEVELREYVLMEDGSVVPDVIQNIPIRFRNKKANFLLTENQELLTPTYMGIGEDDLVIRGFSLRCKNGSNDWEYGFIIRTDISKED